MHTICPAIQEAKISQYFIQFFFCHFGGRRVITSVFPIFEEITGYFTPIWNNKVNSKFKYNPLFINQYFCVLFVLVQYCVNWSFQCKFQFRYSVKIQLSNDIFILIGFKSE